MRSDIFYCIIKVDKWGINLVKYNDYCGLLCHVGVC